MNRSISDVSHPETVTFDIKPLKKACSSPSNERIETTETSTFHRKLSVDISKRYVFFQWDKFGIYICIYIRIYHIYICNGTSWYIMEYNGINNGINDGYMPRLRALRVEPMAFPVAFDGEAWHGEAW